MAGAYLAIGSCFSSASKNQVIAFVLAVLVSLLFTVSGTPLVLELVSGWAPALVVDVIAGLKTGTEYLPGNSYLIKADIEKSGASHDH